MDVIVAGVARVRVKVGVEGVVAVVFGAFLLAMLAVRVLGAVVAVVVAAAVVCELVCGGGVVAGVVLAEGGGGAA